MSLQLYTHYKVSHSHIFKKQILKAPQAVQRRGNIYRPIWVSTYPNVKLLPESKLKHEGFEIDCDRDTFCYPTTK